MTMLKLSSLQRWQNRSFDIAEIDSWLDLLDDFGPQLLRFLIDETCAGQIPEEDEILLSLRKQIAEHPLPDLKPKRGNVWILFAFRESLSNLPFPFRKDGILLPFEWRKGREIAEHSPLLPENLKILADRVKEQLGDAASGYYLYPDSIFGDQIDFSMEGVGFSSGWGALISGLYLAINPKALLLEWPFSSIQYDFEKGEMDAVGHLEAKIKLCASFGAQEFAVAQNQYVEAVKTLELLRIKCPEDRKFSRMKIFLVQNSRDFMQLAADIAKCNQHHRQRLIRNLCLMQAAVLLFLAVIAGLFYWDQNHVVKKYYVDMTDDGKGLLKGIGEITKKNVADRYASYMFSYQGRTSLFGDRILRSVQNVNSAFFPFHPGLFSLKETFTEYRMQYNEQKEPMGITVCREPGEITHTWSYADKRACLADKSAPAVMEDILESAKIPLDFTRSEDKKDPVRRVQFLRNGSGQIIGKRFKQGTSDKLSADADGICGENYDRIDRFGRVLQTSFVDCNGQPTCNAGGVSRIEYKYDDLYLSSIRFLNKDGKPQNRGKEEPYNCIQYTYDAYGNIAVATFLTGTESTEIVVKREYTYLSGNIVREIFRDGNDKVTSDTQFTYDAHGNPNLIRFLVSKEKRPYNMTHMSWDVLPGQKRRLKEQVFLNEKGKLCPNENGFAKLAYEYNAQGSCTKEERFGTDGKRKGDANHVAIIRRAYDKQNRLIRCWYYDAQNKPVLNDYGFAEKRIIFSDDGKTVTEYYCDTNGNAAFLPEHGYSSICILLDDQKRPQEYRTCGPGGKLSLNAYGWAVRKILYDKYGNIRNETYYGTDGKKVIAYPGKDISAAEIRMERNSSGQILVIGYYGPDGNLLEQPSGIPALTRYRYDSRNRCTEEAFFSYDKQPFLHKVSPLTVESEPKSFSHPQIFQTGMKGVRIEVSYWGDSNTAKMKRVHLKNGEYFEFNFTPFGKMEKEAYFLANGQPALNSLGIASIHCVYNEKQQEICREFLAQDGKSLILSRQGIAGWSSTYNDHGNLDEIVQFGKEREPRRSNDGVAIVRFFYNDRGQITKRLFYDENRVPVHNPDGASCICAKYDDQGRLIEEYMMNEKNEIIVSSRSKVAITRIEYWEEGSEKIIRRKYLDAAGIPCLDYEKKGGVIEHYDTKGYLTEKWAIDTQGKPMNILSQIINPVNNLFAFGNIKFPSHRYAGNVAGIQMKYDSRGNQTFVQYYDKNRKVCPVILMTGNGNAVAIKNIRRTFTASGLLQEEFSELCNQGDNAQYIRIVYDHFRHTTKSCFLDIGRKPVVSRKLGFSMHLLRFNKAGLPLDEAWFDDKETLQNAPGETYAIMHIKYSENPENQIEEIRYCNRYDIPVVSRNAGFALLNIEYDPFGRVRELTYRDEKGDLILAKGISARVKFIYHSNFGNKRTCEFYNEKNELIRTGTED